MGQAIYNYSLYGFDNGNGSGGGCAINKGNSIYENCIGNRFGHGHGKAFGWGSGLGKIYYGDGIL